MAADPENTLILTLENGPVTIELLPDLAPGHVARIKELAREGFYEGVVFHRVIPGFMAQGGDPTGSGSGGSDKPDLRAEFSKEPHVLYMSQTRQVFVAGVEIDDPAHPGQASEWQTPEVGRLRDVQLTTRAFRVDPRFNRTDPQYSSGVICSVE